MCKPDEFAGWLDYHLERRGGAYLREFIGRVFDACNEYRRSVRAHNPVWVTTWSRFELVKNSRPERWSEFVGVTRLTAEQWLVVLRYRAAETGTLVRPTQLDAGWYAYHFPSPPPWPVHQGGIVVDLEGAAAGLTPEYIHAQIDLRPEFWQNSGELLRRTAREVSPELQGVRVRHWLQMARDPRVGRAALEIWRNGDLTDITHT